MSNLSDSSLARAILQSNPYGIRALNGFEEIKCCLYNDLEYIHIDHLLRTNDIDALRGLPNNRDMTKDLLTIVKITAEDGREFYVTEYDPFDLLLDAGIIGYYSIEAAAPSV
jgi:hypothetical protein